MYKRYKDEGRALVLLRAPAPAHATRRDPGWRDARAGMQGSLVTGGFARAAVRCHWMLRPWPTCCRWSIAWTERVATRHGDKNK